MKKPSVHFIYDENKEFDARLAVDLVAAFGQADLTSAKTIVAIGGDGALMHALHLAEGRKIIGLVAPGSNSAGFWANRGVKNAADFATVLKTARSYTIKPLRADIEFADGSNEVRIAYNDISIKLVDQEPTDWLKEQYKLPANDVSLQSALLSLRVEFSKAAHGPHRIMGNGLIFATPFGSTAMNRSFGGPSVDIRNHQIVLTGMGISAPSKGFNSVVNSGDTVFTIDVESPKKRPVIISYDSFGMKRSLTGSPISKLKVSASDIGSARLVLTDDPATRAYSSMTP